MIVKCNSCGSELAVRSEAEAAKLYARINGSPPPSDLSQQARELVQNWSNDSTEDGQWLIIGKGKVLIESITTFVHSAVEAAVLAERERCAKLVENYHECPSTNDYNIAAAIRVAAIEQDAETE